MSASEITFELRLTPKDEAEKAKLIDWLHDQGENEFVEGQLTVDINHDYSNSNRDLYAECGGGVSPISLYRFEKSELEELQAALESSLEADVQIELLQMDSKVWMEGWKESFRPFATEKFYVYPPWEDEQAGSELIPLEIEPGMAFGTGQHATTQLCLKALENLDVSHMKSCLDVGTGTGILAIAAHKLGIHKVFATDIEGDAVKATLENAKQNQVDIHVSKQSVPGDLQCDLVFANILSVVLEVISADLERALAANGMLILSGILAEEKDTMAAKFTAGSLQLVRDYVQDGWVALCLTKPGE